MTEIAQPTGDPNEINLGGRTRTASWRMAGWLGENTARNATVLFRHQKNGPALNAIRGSVPRVGDEKPRVLHGLPFHGI